jgi:hypothetical protein
MYEYPSLWNLLIIVVMSVFRLKPGSVPPGLHRTGYFPRSSARNISGVESTSAANTEPSIRMDRQYAARGCDLPLHNAGDDDRNRRAARHVRCWDLRLAGPYQMAMIVASTSLGLSSVRVSGVVL